MPGINRKLLKSLSEKDIEVKNRYKRYIIGMIENEVDIKDLADEIGVSEQMIFYVMQGKKKSKKVEDELNRILKIEGVA